MLRHKSFSTLMCTKDQRIENSHFVSNTTKSKLSIIKFRVTLLQQILNASNEDLLTEINVRKRRKRSKGRKYMSFFTT